jgi:hypothetical protein
VGKRGVWPGLREESIACTGFTATPSEFSASNSFSVLGRRNGGSHYR